jgi:4-carboxymuconolactone decarboxylase
MTSEDREGLERGRRLAREHLGDEVTERWGGVSPDLEELTARFFGEVWGRPGLPRRERSIVAMAATASLRAAPQLAWHVRGALRAGVTPEEVREVMIAVAGFAGFPAAWQAIEVAEEVMARGRDADAPRYQRMRQHPPEAGA